jgi:hypothetical protein
MDWIYIRSPRTELHDKGRISCQPFSVLVYLRVLMLLSLFLSLVNSRSLFLPLLPIRQADYMTVGQAVPVSLVLDLDPRSPSSLLSRLRSSTLSTQLRPGSWVSQTQTMTPQRAQLRLRNIDNGDEAQGIKILLSDVERALVSCATPPAVRSTALGDHPTIPFGHVLFPTTDSWIDTTAQRFELEAIQSTEGDGVNQHRQCVIRQMLITTTIVGVIISCVVTICYSVVRHDDWAGGCTVGAYIVATVVALPALAGVGHMRLCPRLETGRERV